MAIAIKSNNLQPRVNFMSRGSFIQKMKNYFNILILFLVFSCKTDINKNLSDIKIDPVIFKLDTLEIGKSITHDILIENNSSIPLEILGIQPSCNCTVIDDDMFIIPSNSKYNLKIDYLPTERGFHQESIVIKSNTDPPFHIIKIQSYVK